MNILLRYVCILQSSSLKRNKVIITHPENLSSKKCIKMQKKLGKLHENNTYWNHTLHSGSIIYK